MSGLIDAAFSRTRAVVMVFVFLLVAGATAYVNIPKEAEPDIPIPLVYVSMSHDGISPEDAERLLLRPMEKELKTIAGIKEIRSTAGEGYGAVTLEFDAGFDSETALRKVREEVDQAKSELPADTKEPVVSEVNTSLFPILTVVLSGDVPERTLVTLARRLREQLEGLPGVLEVDIGGDRTDVLEIIVRPTILETYNISFEQVLNLIQRNNRLVAAGVIDTGFGRFVIKVPGVIEEMKDLLTMPIKTVNGRVVTFSDVATVRRAYKDPTSFARVDGRPSLALEIKKRVGANIISTVAAVKAQVRAAQKELPDTIRVSFLQDKSEDIRTMLGDLENNVLAAIILVMVVIVAALGLRSSVLVGLSIPGAFLLGVLVLSAMGITLNIVVLFSLILVVGMLVDGAIVTTELADRRMADGDAPKSAFAYAAKRMAWPIIASTATTLAVFVPLVFWPGVVGEFMKYLPITVLATLGASLLMALVFIPVLGGLIGRPGALSDRARARLAAAETGDLSSLTGLAGWYTRRLRRVVEHPGKVFAAVVLLLIGSGVAYGTFGNGVEFFPSVEPKFAQVQVRARGDLSIHEKDRLVRQVEQRIAGTKGVKFIYARTIGARGKTNVTEDTIGVIQLELVEWDRRRTAEKITEEILRKTATLPGIVVEVQKQNRGPTSGKPIVVDVSSRNAAQLLPAVNRIRQAMEKAGGIVDISDNRPLPGIEWRLVVDRRRAAEYGADIAVLGQAVRLVTAGIIVAEYRPEDADEEVDIVLRFPPGQRSLEQMRRLRVPTARGLVPIRNFVEIKPAPKTGVIERIDSRRTITIQADVRPGAQVARQVALVRQALADAGFPDSVLINFKGETKDQAETGAFLGQAFLVAIFLMTLFLVIQFNSLGQAALVMSAIVFSTAGVLLGLLVTGQPFGIVMGGLGLIALAGIVVNNNIVLIDTFNDLRRRGMDVKEAILRTGAQRMRPVLLTSITTVLGLIPMVLALNLDFIDRKVQIGAPSSQWWTQLSSAIAGGLVVATFLTLVFTPAMLMLLERRRPGTSRNRFGLVGRLIGRLRGRRRPRPPGGTTEAAT